jgi:hypothetical protein
MLTFVKRVSAGSISLLASTSIRRGCAVEGAKRATSSRVATQDCQLFLSILDLCQIRAQARMAA